MMVISYNTLGGGKKIKLKVDQPSHTYHERDCKVCHMYIILKGEYESPIQDLNPSLNPLGLTHQRPCVRTAAVVFRSEKRTTEDALCTLDVGSRATPISINWLYPSTAFSQVGLLLFRQRTKRRESFLTPKSYPTLLLHYIPLHDTYIHTLLIHPFAIQFQPQLLIYSQQS